jgi:hypothetical protein
MKKPSSSLLCTLFCASSLLSTQPVLANIDIDFIEGAPKDTFVITNTNTCTTKSMLLTIDLSPSMGKLIFDTTAADAGAEVFQPFEVTKGNIKLVDKNTQNDATNGVRDGNSELSLQIGSLQSQESVSFTIDVDDTLPKSALGKIRVSTAEIENGVVQLMMKGKWPIIAPFNSSNKATIVLPPCA